MRTAKRAALVAVILILVYVCFYSPGREFDGALAQRKRQRVSAAGASRIDYSSFSHRTHAEKRKMACDACHKFPSGDWKDLRKGDAAVPDVAEFPKHESCIGCHRAQFFSREMPAPAICGNCHTAVSPRDTARYLFPSLGDVTDTSRKRREAVSEFVVAFPHDKHVDVIGQGGGTEFGMNPVQVVRASFRPAARPQESDPKSCQVCHQTYQPQGDSPEEYVTKPPANLGDAFWLKKGTFKTIPNSHLSCFSCHSADSGLPPAPADCASCHKLVPAGSETPIDYDQKIPQAMGVTDFRLLARWMRRGSSGTFLHDAGLHPTVACTSCHQIQTMNVADPRTLKVAVKSCGGSDGCHITATLDEGGALNTELEQRRQKPDSQCVKCHLVFGSKPVPPSHLAAVPKAAK